MYGVIVSEPALRWERWPWAVVTGGGSGGGVGVGGAPWEVRPGHQVPREPGLCSPGSTPPSGNQDPWHNFQPSLWYHNYLP